MFWFRFLAFFFPPVCLLETIVGTVCLQFYNSRPHGNSRHAVFIICFRCFSWPWLVSSHTSTVFCWILHRDLPQISKILCLTSSLLSGLYPNSSYFDLPGLSTPFSPTQGVYWPQPGFLLTVLQPRNSPTLRDRN